MAEAKTGEELPPLSDHDFKIYNHMAEKMDYFHNHFRQEWDLLWQAATSGRRQHGMSLKQFIQHGLAFAEHLTMHHTIEERHVFPMLARRMAVFDPKKGPMVAQHALIHDGLLAFQTYLKQCRSGEVDLEMPVLKARMESWGTVLWEHLDEEVKNLGAENMRKYYTAKEMQGMRM